MIKILIIVATEFLLCLSLLAYSIYHESAFYINVLILVLLIVISLLGYLVNKQRKIVKFLLEDNKKGKAGSIINWNTQEAEEVMLIKKRMELSVLQEQINPHFLYNTLDCIRSRALMDGHGEIAKMTEILSRFFRYCISNSENLVQVREELNHIQDYYYIQKYRFEDKVEMEINVEQESVYELYLPKMTLQPLVENAMIHGLEKIAEPGKIEIRMFITDKKLIIVISDNGIGMKQEQLMKLNERMQNHYYNTFRKNDRNNGIALNNVNVRLKMTFGDDYGIHYRSLEGEGTDAVVTLPIVDVFARVRYEEKLNM